jgi:CBS domain-containing protein
MKTAVHTPLFPENRANRGLTVPEKRRMSEETTFFLPVKDYCQRRLIVCQLEDRVVDAAIIMRDKSISSLIACDDQNQPVGILTDRDLRSKVVAGGLDPAKTVVREIMNAPVIAVREEDSLFEVLYQMSHHRIHRVGVVDEQNRLVGIINESDIIRLQNRSPQKLLRGIDEATTIAELKTVFSETEQLIVFLSNQGVRIRDLVRLISLFNDQIALRLIELLRRDGFGNLPKGCAFLVLGSEGRREQTLKTDQDNAIIYADDLTAEEVASIQDFSGALIAGLIEIGVPECPGGIMARNESWRRSLAAWKDALNSWIAIPSGDNILNFSMFSDMRTLWGDSSLERQLRDHVIQCAQENTIFLAHMAANVCRFEPPLGFFGGIKTEKQGEHAGQLDLKKAGIFAITEGVKTLALELGTLGGSTHDKLTILQERGVLDGKQVDDLEAAFNLLSFFRLRGQIAAAAAGRTPDNFLSPSALDRVEKGRLQIALEVVQSFEGTLRAHFNLSLLGS